MADTYHPQGLGHRPVRPTMIGEKGILPFYKGEGSRTDCRNYRGITLLSVPGKVYAHVLQNRIKAHHHLRRTEQSGFTPHRSTIDRIATLNMFLQTRRDYRKPCWWRTSIFDQLSTLLTDSPCACRVASSIQGYSREDTPASRGPIQQHLQLCQGGWRTISMVLRPPLEAEL